VDYVDLDRFMGSWYVIAIIPNFIEKNAVNGIETYIRGEGNKVKIEYKFRKNTATGKEKIMYPKAEVYDTKSNAEWRVQFIWPLKFPYLVVDLAEDYRYTVIGVPNKKFVWIMSRLPQMNPEDYQETLDNMTKLGYDIEKIVKMPQIWSE
jgi:apolipoprotein D and lipocalin family protein